MQQHFGDQSVPGYSFCLKLIKTVSVVRVYLTVPDSTGKGTEIIKDSNYQRQTRFVTNDNTDCQNYNRTHYSSCRTLRNEHAIN